ncbi:hypothetical protein D3C71_1878730 [compost metagenome]
MAPQPLARAQRGAGQRQAGIKQRGLLPPCQQIEIGGGQQRKRQQQPEHLRPEKLHALLLGA